MREREEWREEERKGREGEWRDAHVINLNMCVHVQYMQNLSTKSY